MWKCVTTGAMWSQRMCVSLHQLSGLQLSSRGRHFWPCPKHITHDAHLFFLRGCVSSLVQLPGNWQRGGGRVRVGRQRLGVISVCFSRGLGNKAQKKKKKERRKKKTASTLERVKASFWWWEGAQGKYIRPSAVSLTQTDGLRNKQSRAGAGA